MHASRVFFICFSVLIAISCTKKITQETPPELQPPSPSIHASELAVDEKGLSKLKAVLKTTRGDFVIKFFPQKSPNTVTRVIQLIQSGFYNGIAFHRVENNYLIQTGDPTGTGRGGSGFKINAEFNDITHTKGIVAMARTANPHSADSQFYIALNTLTHLDGKYTIFGKVVEGENLLNTIVVGDKILSLTIENDIKEAPASH